MAVAFAGVMGTGEAVAQTRFDEERDAVRADYQAETERTANDMYAELRDMQDVPRGWMPYLTRVDLARCEYNPAIRLQPAPTVAELTGTRTFDDQYSFSPRSDFLARQESVREDVRDTIVGACADIRQSGIDRERELADIAREEAEARRSGQ